MVHMHFKTENFSTKQPLIPRLARKNKMAGLNSYLASGCRFILCVFLYTVKNRKQKLDVGKQSLRPLPFLSGEENVLHAFLFLAFLFLRFRKVEEVQHIIVIPSDSHSGINYPPTFVGPPLSLQKGAAYGMLPICKAFVCLPFYKRSFHIPLQSSWGYAAFERQLIKHTFLHTNIQHSTFHHPPAKTGLSIVWKSKIS